MAVPDYQSLMLPLLKYAAKKAGELSANEAVEALAKELNLTDQDLREMLPSGTQATFVNRVGWAATYMKKAGLLEGTRRGYYKITDRGMALLQRQPNSINVKVLQQYPEFVEFQKLKGTKTKDKEANLRDSDEISAATPSEALDRAYENLREELAWIPTRGIRPNGFPHAPRSIACEI